MSEWKTIDSAPNHKEILVFEGGTYMLGENDDGYWYETTEYRPITPTHWMELPEPPTRQEKES